jgi:hypothetical protein
MVNIDLNEVISGYFYVELLEDDQQEKKSVWEKVKVYLNT